jgi:hypothetical protein
MPARPIDWPCGRHSPDFTDTERPDPQSEGNQTETENQRRGSPWPGPPSRTGRNVAGRD